VLPGTCLKKVLRGLRTTELGDQGTGEDTCATGVFHDLERAKGS
jgi:hypothetical protein